MSNSSWFSNIFDIFRVSKACRKNRPKTMPPIWRFKNERKREIMLSPYDRTNRQGGGFPENLGRFLEFYAIFFIFLKSSFFGFLLDFLIKKFFFLARAFRTRRDLQVFVFRKKWTYFLHIYAWIKIAFLLEEKVSVSICNFLGSYAAFANIPD